MVRFILLQDFSFPRWKLRGEEGSRPPVVWRFATGSFRGTPALRTFVEVGPQHSSPGSPGCRGTTFTISVPSPHRGSDSNVLPESRNRRRAYSMIARGQSLRTGHHCASRTSQFAGIAERSERSSRNLPSKAMTTALNERGFRRRPLFPFMPRRPHHGPTPNSRFILRSRRAVYLFIRPAETRRIEFVGRLAQLVRAQH
jgi:hypothetical protein